MIVSQKVPETASLMFFRDSSTESSRDSFVDIFLATVSVAVPETASLIYSRDSSSDSFTESSRDSFVGVF